MAASRSGAAPGVPPREGLRLFLIAAAVTALFVLPVGVAVGMSWVDLPWAAPSPARAQPEWLALPQVRATTLDGNVVKARVALDVSGASVRGTIQRNTQQVGLVLETAVAAHTREQIRSAEGIEHLSGVMRDRLNQYLESEGDHVVRSVAIQDLIFNPQ